MKLAVKSAKVIVCRLLGWSLLASRLISFAFITVACATPIGINRVDMRAAQRELTTNALTTDQPSAFPPSNS